ncbi:uncharacterized protein [Ptychodera flava]|uniref:uncharacterized protein n=1 Tax=Ptychodera flava TaxID=63121 RepID=UPI00396A26EE
MKEETSQVFVFHVSQLMLQLIQSSVDEAFCISLVKSNEENTLSLHALWSFKVVSNFSKCKDYLRESMQPLLRHVSPTVRIETAKRLMLNGKGLLAVDSAQESDKNHIIEIFTQNGFAMGPPSIPKVHTPNPTYSTWSGTLNYKHVKLLVQTPKSLEDIANDANTSTKRKTVFNQEVQFLRQTTNHSNIVDLLGYQCQPSPCLIITEEWKETVSEYLLKQSRAGILRDVKELIELFLLPMLSAVIFCHKRNIILRDIVANNFFVQNPLKKHMVKYFNFRLAKRQRRESTQPDESAIYEDIMSDEIKGAPDDQIPMRYSAPESLMKNAYSTGSDSWMCTCLSYEVLTHGCQPYTELYGIRTEDVIQLVIQGYRIKQPPCIPDIVFMPMMGGVIHEPARRTTVNDLYDSLQEFSDRISALSATTEQKPLMIACQPPMRDTEQQSEPCRGIPENLQKPNTSSDEASLYDRTHNVTYWLNWEEILGPDEPSITTDKRFFHERVLSDRNPDDNEEIKLLTKHSNICQVVNLFQDKEGILCQEYVNHGGEGLLLLCIEKHCGVDELLGYLRDTAVALAYIHGQGWIHACLKARYIMVREGAAKVSRLGRAFRPEVLLYDKGSDDAIHTQEMPQDLLRWAPPEVIFYGMFSQKGDVFMFAQVCWEAFNALAFDSNSAEECFLPYPNKSAEQVKESLTKRNHQFQPTSCPDWLYQLMKYMWLCERSLRPPFDMIIRCFDAKSLQPLKQELETQPTHLLGKGSHYHSQIRKRLQYDDEQQNNYFERGTKRQQIAHGFQYGDVSRIVHSTKYTDVQSGKVYCRPIDMEPPVKIDETFSPSARRGNKKRSMRNVLPNVFRLRSSRSKSAKEEHQNSKQEFPHDSGVESSTSLSVKVKHRSMIGPSPSSYPLRSSEISSPKKPPTERLPEIPFKPPSSTDAMDYIYEVPEISEVRPPEKPKIPPKPKNLKQKVPPRAKVKEIPREMQTDRDHNDYECLNFTADPTSYTALMKGDTHGVSHTENGESKSSTVQQPEIDVEADGNQRVPLCLHSSEQEDTESTLTLENPEESSAFDSECESSYANAGQTSSDQGDETC